MPALGQGMQKNRTTHWALKLTQAGWKNGKNALCLLRTIKQMSRSWYGPCKVSVIRNAATRKSMQRVCSPHFIIFWGGWGGRGIKFQNCSGTASKNAEGLLIADHPSESILPLWPPSLNPNKSETRMTACISKQDQITPISLYITIMPIFFQTLEALNTPKVKTRKARFHFSQFNCCFVTWQRGLPWKVPHVLDCHIKFTFLLTFYALGPNFSSSPSANPWPEIILPVRSLYIKGDPMQRSITGPNNRKRREKNCKKEWQQFFSWFNFKV